MKSFKEKKYKYKFFKAILDKDYSKIPTYIQKYLEYCNNSDIKNIFYKINNLHGGSVYDKEKKYKYKFFKAISDKNYTKLPTYVLKYAKYTREHDIKNMFGGTDHVVVTPPSIDHVVVTPPAIDHVVVVTPPPSIDHVVVTPPASTIEPSTVSTADDKADDEKKAT